MTAGAAMPAVIEQTFQSLLNDNFDEAYRKINDVRSGHYNYCYFFVISRTIFEAFS